jgi:pyridoxine/pyridoxamine 5'-phosphate oxidase
MIFVVIVLFRSFLIHDRIAYTKEKETWTIERLAP